MSADFAYILVYSTGQALRLEKLLLAAGVDCKPVPVPRHLSSDCGICLRIAPEDGEATQKVVAASGLDVPGLKE
jgi:hypothetical protein